MAIGAMMMMAPPVPDRGQALVEALRTCSIDAAEEQRVACYDRAVAALMSALDERSVAVVDRETVRRTQRSLFGFVAPNLSIFGLRKNGDQQEDEVRELHGVARSVRETAPDHFEVALEDGAVWKNVDAFRRPPRPGDKVTIVKAALGSFFMTIDGSRIGTRCARAR